MPKTKILIALLLSIVIAVLLASCYIFNNDDDGMGGSDTMTPTTNPTTTTSDSFYFYTDKDGETEDYAPFEFFEGFEFSKDDPTTTITDVQQTSGGADNTTKYRALTGTGKSWAAGGWLNANNKTIDLSKYNTLVFWIKSATTTNIKFRMEDVGEDHTSGAAAPDIEKPITQHWVKHEISFAEFNISDATKVEALVYIFTTDTDQIDLDEVYVYNRNDAPTITTVGSSAENKTVTLSFSEAIQFGMGGDLNGTGFAIAGNKVLKAAISGNVLTLTLEKELVAGAKVTVAIAANAIVDMANTPVAFVAGNSPEITVRAPDTTAPTITATENSAREKTVVVSFSEDIQFGTGGDASGKGFAIAGNTVSKAIISSNVLTLTVATMLEPGKTLVVAIAENAIVDKATNPNAFVAGDSPEITILAPPDKVAPEIVRTTPSIETQSISITFNERIKRVEGPGIGGFAVFTGTDTAQSTQNMVSETLIKDQVLILKLQDALNANDYISVAIGDKAVSDLDGNGIGGTHTAAVKIIDDTGAPTIVSKLAFGRIVRITFNENIVYDLTKPVTIAGFTVSNVVVIANLLEITLSSDLTAGTNNIEVMLPTGSIKDTSPDSHALVATTTGKFSVDPAGIFFYTDASNQTEQTILPHNKAYENTLTAEEQTSGGANGTAKYLRLTRLADTGWGAGGWSVKGFTTTTDLSDYSVLVFWAKSDNATSVRFAVQSGNIGAREISSTINSTWARYEISFADLHVGDSSIVSDVKYVLPNVGDIIDIDEVHVARK